MNHNALLIPLLLAASLPLCGCNKAGKLNERSTTQPPAGPVEFKLKWPQGERVEQDFNLKMQSDLAIPGQPAPMHQDMTMGFAYGLTVLAANPDGTHEIEMDILSSRMQMSMAGKTLADYDSTRKTDAEEKPVPGGVSFGKLFGKMIGAKIHYFLDASNGVDRIEGVDELMNRVSAGANPQELMSMKSMLNEGYFKQMMSANLMLPTKPVQPGDTWSVQLEFPMGPMGTMTMNYDFTFQNWEMHGKRSCARLTFQGDVTSKPDPAANAGAMSMTIQDGTISGISWFDPELGITIDTTANQNLNLIIQMSIPGAHGQAPKVQTMTNAMQQSMTIKLGSVK
jgi:hypothetical protein